MESDKSLDHSTATQRPFHRVSRGKNLAHHAAGVTKGAKENLGLGLLETRNQKPGTPAIGRPGRGWGRVILLSPPPVSSPLKGEEIIVCGL